MSSQDHTTRQRLLEVAAVLFAEHGFDQVSVRSICAEADANVAAVNYHFGDKLGLYTAVVERAIDTMRNTSAAAMDAGRGHPAAERLRAHVRVFLERLHGRGRETWIPKLMVRELETPSPALDLVVERVMAPRFAYLAEIVSELLGCNPSDERVARCVASIHGLCLAYPPRALALRLKTTLPSMARLADPETDIADLVDHIVTFALGGLQAVEHAPTRHLTRGARM